MNRDHERIGVEWPEQRPSTTTDKGWKPIMTTPELPPLIPYWIEFAPREWFEVGDYQVAPSPPRAFGVTAASLDEALAIVRAVVFRGGVLPPVVRAVEGADLAMLAMHNMSPGILPPGQPGVWYPAIIADADVPGDQ
jgi:hypothetical protein